MLDGIQKGQFPEDRNLKVQMLRKWESYKGNINTMFIP
jgi:hypothetical protein